MEIEPLIEGKGEACRQIMRDLPLWFPEPEGHEAAARRVDDMDVLVCREEGIVAGLIALEEQTDSAMEIFLLAVDERFHRRGIGRELVDAAAELAKERQFDLLTVKTLAPRGRKEPHLDATRSFYSSVGFLRAEVFPTLWHPDHPCLFMIKPLAARPA
ncbi:TDP-fucosamine acetyltransferase [Hartmannibacter diazotrophicus]|uniref:TDP-fucosamine acetyltransferase n=1 Tax=Hartmannibacter diazotrophicus TaxID=1482074 RepID=A0A2C9D8W5_9HYPH|nr:GNAT family N-acetyltransferase [Hartmannibacter diazotrophicus]SON56673.1 TDP-fucosamine acetyltransferase [Hartmannibacter diazotrophicus]